MLPLDLAVDMGKMMIVDLRRAPLYSAAISWDSVPAFIRDKFYKKTLEFLFTQLEFENTNLYG